MTDNFGFSRRRWSGAGKDVYRDPMQLNDALEKIVHQYKWQNSLSENDLLNMLPTILGDDIYQHIFTAELDGQILRFTTSSTAWSTQLRYMEKRILELINQAQSYTIQRIIVVGPKPPSWRFGPKHISGRGPRDTFG